MARLHNLPSALAWALAIVIAYLERRDPARPRPAEGAGATMPLTSAPQPGTADQPPVETERSEPAVAPAAGLTPDAAAADRGDGAEAGIAASPSAPSTGDVPPPAAAPDPLIDAGAGETIVGPDAPIRHAEGEGPHVPAGAVVGNGTPECPPDHPIKGNATSMIYHRPGQPNYDRTVAEFCFATEHDAEAAGYRPPKR